MSTTAEDLVRSFDFVWARLRHRLIGLDEAEWDWLPTDDAAIGLRWRIQHIAELLREDRNARWLGRAPTAAELKPPDDAVEAVAQLEAAFADWRGHLVALDDAGLRTPVGPVGGPYAGSSRLEFVLHVYDELIHHGAETALLRDLYARR